jgi:ElaB/YqjD/DUF883 family membrane-anchored ribosome-binding protein
MTAQTLSNGATSAGEFIGNGVRAFQRAAGSKNALADALEDKRKMVNRALKRSRDTAQDLVYETTRNIKRFPVRSVAIAFGAGTLLGLLMHRNGRG